MTSYTDWTAAQHSTTVPVDDHELELAYRDEGSGDPVIFLHGIPTNSYLFDGQFEAIATERRAIAPDMVGYGSSAMHDGFDRSIRAQEAAIRGLIDDLGLGTVDFVGHDLGGGVGLRLATRTPDPVDKLVLSNAVAYDSWPIQIITDLGLPETARETSVEELQEMLDDLFRGRPTGDADDEFVEAMKAPWESEEDVTSVVRNAIATNTSHTTDVDPKDVTAETLLLWGTADEFQPLQWAERLEDDIRDCRLVGLDHANHWVPEDRRETFTEHLIEFLL